MGVATPVRKGSQSKWGLDFEVNMQGEEVHMVEELHYSVVYSVCILLALNSFTARIEPWVANLPE